MTYTKKKLKNGLRVITIPMKDNPTVTVLVLVSTGSAYESKKENGLSHFLEHMCFKGTEKRPNAKTISRELDGLGAQYNAWTGHEYTGYFVKSDEKHLDKVFDVVSDLYLNPIFPKDDIEKEKGVIIEEINMYEDMPQRHVADVFMEAFYGDQPVGRNIAGTKENVKSFSRNDLANYHKKHYVPEATVVVVSGNVSEKKVIELSKKTFGMISPKKKEGRSKIKKVASTPEVVASFKKTDQTHFILGFPGYEYGNKKLLHARVLATILGGGMSSRLFTLLREELGAAYYVYASSEAFVDAGHFEIGAGVTTARLPEVINRIAKECMRLKNEVVKKDELDLVKEYLIGNMKLSLESSDAFASFYGNQEVTGRVPKNLVQVEKEIRKVSAKDILAIAKEIFKDKGVVLSYIGTHKDTNTLKKSLYFK